MTAIIARCWAETSSSTKAKRTVATAGIHIGFKDSAEFNVYPSHATGNGAKDIWQMNDVLMVSGLKQDGVLLNRDQKTSEAFAKIAFKILVKRIGAFQRNVAAFLAELFRIELQLNGYPIASVRVVFEAADLVDKLADQQAEEGRVGRRLLSTTNGLYIIT